MPRAQRSGDAGILRWVIHAAVLQSRHLNAAGGISGHGCGWVWKTSGLQSNGIHVSEYLKEHMDTIRRVKLREIVYIEVFFYDSFVSLFFLQCLQAVCVGYLSLFCHWLIFGKHLI